MLILKCLEIYPEPDIEETVNSLFKGEREEGEARKDPKKAFMGGVHIRWSVTQGDEKPITLRRDDSN